MKKLSTILAVIAVVSLASCKKDYTCECKSTPSDSFYDYSTTFHAKKADAKTACDVLDYTTSNGTSTVTVFPVLGSTFVIFAVSFLQDTRAIDDISASAAIFFIRFF